MVNNVMGSTNEMLVDLHQRLRMKQQYIDNFGIVKSPKMQEFNGKQILLEAKFITCTQVCSQSSLIIPYVPKNVPNNL